MRFRIRDLLNGKTLIEATRGRELVAYHAEHYVPGRCDWWWQYKTPQGWAEIPPQVRRAWLTKSEQQSPPS